MGDVKPKGDVIAAFVRDRALQARLAAATRASAGARILWCESPEELYAAVADGGATIAITEWGDPASITLEAMAWRLRQEFPTVPVLVYVPLTPAGAKALLAAGRAGAREAILAGHDDVGRALGAVLARASSLSVAERAVQRLSRLTPPEVLAMLAYALRHARAAPDVSDMARALHLHRKTLADQCRRAGAPPPGELASWGRLVVAAERLSDPGRSAERVAAEFGYSSGSAFANMLKRYTGLTLAEVRLRGPAVVFESLVHRLAASRAPDQGPVAYEQQTPQADPGDRRIQLASTNRS